MIVQTGLGVQGERGGIAMSKCLLTAPVATADRARDHGVARLALPFNRITSFSATVRIGSAPNWVAFRPT